LVAHQHFNTKENVLRYGADELSTKRIVDEELTRKRIRDTNKGQLIQEEIDNLKDLMSHRYFE
ncbi:fructose-bisphosphatase class III, partial [Staphylococcus condimenti]